MQTASRVVAARGARDAFHASPAFARTHVIRGFQQGKSPQYQSSQRRRRCPHGRVLGECAGRELWRRMKGMSCRGSS